MIQLSHRTVGVIDRLNEQLAPLDLSIVVENNQAETMEDNIDQIIRLAIVAYLPSSSLAFPEEPTVGVLHRSVHPDFRLYGIQFLLRGRDYDQQPYVGWYGAGD